MGCIKKKKDKVPNLKELLFLGWEKQNPDNSQNRSLFDIIGRSMLCKKRTQDSGTREAGR